MTDYFARFGAVRDYLRGVVEQAKIDGYTETIFGRRRPFPDLNEPQPGAARERRARGAQLADPGLGRRHHEDRDDRRRRRHRRRRSSAVRMLLQVHDELIFEVAPGECDALERDRRATGWRTPPSCSCRSTCRSAAARNWDAAAH